MLSCLGQMAGNMRKSVKLVREGKFAAEISIELIEDVEDWSPHLSADDARKLDKVRQLLRDGDLAGASRMARVYELSPVSA